MDAARLPEARLRFPQLATDEADAERRVRLAMATGDVKSGANALADWIDAQAAMLAYLTVEDGLRHSESVCSSMCLRPS